MKKLLIILLLALLPLACSSQSPVSSAQAQSLSQGSACKISVVDSQYNPEFGVNELALEALETRPDLKRAYFAMGCFWGSEAMLASAPGVSFTRVGFAGGSLENPSYSAIGDHVETVEVVYDPNITTYSDLLQHFWKHHNARAKPIFRQYASAVFCADESEIPVAKAQRKIWQETTGEEKVLTAIKPLVKFYPADDSHQKYYLQQDKALAQSLPQNRDLLNTRLATKLNAVSGRAGKREVLEQALQEMGIHKEASTLLFKRALWSEN